MFRKQIFCLLAVCGCVLGLSCGALAAQVDCDNTYCFTQADFSQQEGLQGICVTGLPDSETGTVMLGTRVVCVGDILTSAQVEQMTFVPLETESDMDACITYLPIYEDRVESSATMTISIRGKTNQPPVAEDQAMETYKNLANTAALKASDPEGKALTFTVTRQPKRGSVEINEDGTFTYTPKKNKVGVDSFTYTATDPTGNVSREATVTVTVLKPTDSTQYSDTTESSCRFEAEWLKNTGIFVGEQLGGQLVFNENEPVSRGEFLAMAVQVLGIPVDESMTTSVYTDDIPAWLRPYLAAAVRSGVTAGLPISENGAFGANETITSVEAAVMLQNALDLAVSVDAMDSISEAVPDWASAAVAAMADNGVDIDVDQTLSRGDAALLLYQISKLVSTAPGLQMYQ